MAKSKKRSVEQLAEIIELTPRRIAELVREGVLPRPARGVYPLVMCVQAYIRHLRNIAQGRGRDPTAGTFDDARRRKTSAEAELAEMQLARERGELLPIEDYTRELTAILERLRARLLNLPGKHATQILGIRTVAEAQLRLEAAIAEAMTELTVAGDIGEEERGSESEDMADRSEGTAA